MNTSIMHELEARELWTTCIHEHGHEVVANVLGVPAWARVWPNDDSSPETKLWRGRTHILRSVDHDLLPVICMAGLVSEVLLIQFPEEGYTFADAEQQAENIRRHYPAGRHSKRTAMTEWCGSVMAAINDQFEAGYVSQTDAEGMGDIWPKRIRRTVGLVMKHSDEIRFRAECRKERVLDEYPRVSLPIERITG